MLIYRFDDAGIYVGSEDAFMDHFGNPLLPPYTCLLEPPVSEDEREVAVWDLARGVWELKVDYRGYEYFVEAGASEPVVITELGVSPPEGHSTSYIKTLEDIRGEKEVEVRAHYSEGDLELEFKGYDVRSDRSSYLRTRDYLSYIEGSISNGGSFKNILFEKEGIFLELTSIDDLRELCFVMLENITNNDLQLTRHLKALSELDDEGAILSYDYRLELV